VGSKVIDVRVSLETGCLVDADLTDAGHSSNENGKRFCSSKQADARNVTIEEKE
jgi:hypothetical protein